MPDMMADNAKSQKCHIYIGGREPLVTMTPAELRLNISRHSTIFNSSHQVFPTL